MQFKDLFIHVYWHPAWFWGLAIVLAAIDILATWSIGRAVRISGPGGQHSRPLLSARRRVYINLAILGSFPVLSVLRFYHRPGLALAWFLGSQLVIGLISVRPMLGRLIAIRRSYGPVARRLPRPAGVPSHG
jgi:hypothetical protein